MAPLIGAVAAVVGIILALLNIREKLWPKHPKAHPLEPAVIAMTHTLEEIRDRLPASMFDDQRIFR